MTPETWTPWQWFTSIALDAVVIGIYLHVFGWATGSVIRYIHAWFRP